MWALSWVLSLSSWVELLSFECERKFGLLCWVVELSSWVELWIEVWAELWVWVPELSCELSAEFEFSFWVMSWVVSWVCFPEFYFSFWFLSLNSKLRWRLHENVSKMPRKVSDIFFSINNPLFKWKKKQVDLFLGPLRNSELLLQTKVKLLDKNITVSAPILRMKQVCFALWSQLSNSIHNSNSDIRDTWQFSPIVGCGCLRFPVIICEHGESLGGSKANKCAVECSPRGMKPDLSCSNQCTLYQERSHL